MPLYEYQCTTCGAIEEAIQKFSDAPLTTCQQCAGKLNKLISQSSFHLKGTGWYVTDYNKKPPAATESKSQESTTSGVEKKAAGGAETNAAKSDN